MLNAFIFGGAIYSGYKILRFYGSNFSNNIYDCANSGYLSRLAELVRNGADINERIPASGITPFLCAVDGKQLDVVKYLISQNAVINAEDRVKALFAAVRNDDLDMLKYFMEELDFLPSRTDDDDRWGKLLLAQAAQGKRYQILRYLLQWECYKEFTYDSMIDSLPVSKRQRDAVYSQIGKAIRENDEEQFEREGMNCIRRHNIRMVLNKTKIPFEVAEYIGMEHDVWKKPEPHYLLKFKDKMRSAVLVQVTNIVDHYEESDNVLQRYD